jgi:excisionase family DNA binding protein
MTSPRPDSSGLTQAFYSIGELAERYEVSERTVRRWVIAGDLVAHRFGHQLRVSAADRAAFERLRRDV